MYSVAAFDEQADDGDHVGDVWQNNAAGYHAVKVSLASCLKENSRSQTC